MWHILGPLNWFLSFGGHVSNKLKEFTKNLHANWKMEKFRFSWVDQSAHVVTQRNLSICSNRIIVRLTNWFPNSTVNHSPTILYFWCVCRVYVCVLITINLINYLNNGDSNWNYLERMKEHIQQRIFILICMYIQENCSCVCVCGRKCVCMPYGEKLEIECQYQEGEKKLCPTETHTHTHSWWERANMYKAYVLNVLTYLRILITFNEILSILVF